MLGGFLREARNQQHLGECVVLAGDALLQPGPRDVERLRKEPGARVAIGVILLNRAPRQQVGDLLHAPVLQEQVVHRALTEDWRHLRLKRHVPRGER